MSDLLVILNPRQIPECVDSLRALPIDKAWVTGYTEQQLQTILPGVIASTHHDRILLVSDDVIVKPFALEAVIRLLDAGRLVATGYCNLDATEPFVNLCDNELPDGKPVKNSYHFWTRRDVDAWPHDVLPSTFAGFALTGMSRGMWLDFPFECFTTRSSDPGFGSDFHLSRRLGRAGVPILAAAGGFVHHVKEEWSKLDQGEGKGLLVGKVEPKVTLDFPMQEAA